MLRLTIAGTLTAILLTIATTTGYAAQQGGYSRAVYPGSERVHSSSDNASTCAAHASAAQASSSQGGLVRKCIPQACGTPWCFMTRNP